jgi:hypothetical protein
MNEQPLKLLADGMLGSLAKWLRILGYDTGYDNTATDPELARRARAEGRVLLTRDRELAQRSGLRTLLIQSEALEAQLREVREALGPPPDPALTRCSVCNTVLEPLAREEAAKRVPPYVLRTHQAFRHCPTCDQVYWAGSHVRAMRCKIEDLAEE